MSNPWTKKNPWMSMWLSGVHKAAGSARGLAAAETKRQANTATREGTRQVLDFWAGLMAPPAAAKRKKKSR